MGANLWVYSGGWLHWPVRGSELEIRVRFVEGPSGRLEAADVWISHKEGISATALRSVPLGKIEARINDPGIARIVREKMNDHLAMPEKELFALKNRLAPEGPAELDLSVFPIATLKIPSTRRKPDSFYREVAETYQQLASIDRAPAVVLAKANHVPVTTVHRWVKEARARGFLAPGRRLGRNQERAKDGDTA